MVAALAVDLLVTERHLVNGTCVYMYQRRRDALCLFGLQWLAHMIRVSHTGVSYRRQLRSHSAYLHSCF